MARENKQKRHERRFGKAERLADTIDFKGWQGVPIEATNVHRYYLDFMERHGSMNLKDEIPCARLPFPDTFIEMQCSNLGNVKIGWAFEDIEPHGELSRKAAEANANVGPTDLANGWVSAVHGMLFFEGFDKPFGSCVYHMTDDGRMVENPAIRCGSELDLIARTTSRSGSDSGLGLAMECFVPCVLALSFLSCSNVVLQPHDPDRDINRERKKNGLRPFVRFHTINIDPMKKVLRTEGGVEHNGLAKAMHICRGHFATYGSSFMGRALDKPMRVWRPAHVRGSADNGLIVTDYKIGAGANS